MKYPKTMDTFQTKLFTSQDIDEKVLIYNIRIVPPEPIYSQVLNYKTEFIATYGEHLLSKSKPHITIAKFIMSSLHQNFLVEHFESLVSTEKFNLQINGFGIFESSGTLVLQINKSAELDVLLKNISDLKRALLLHKAKNFGLIYTPHLTISSFLDSKTLHSSLSHFKNIAYSKKPFEVDHLMITSRENGKTWDWEHQINFT
ncbi:MAG: 2'-5' RNA ligase family protein [Flavobacteriaceae bacterium]|nr:2'-5' RNA ligase family protein [Mangrovimonas sp.]HRV54058.1 2'-5' RNA ligase family protein [Mangrovimonas sp.]